MKIKPNQIILFDIDKTMHDNDEFRRLYREKISKHYLIDDDAWEKALQGYDKSLKIRRLSHAKKLIKHMAHELNIDIKKFRQAHYDIDNYEKALFKDVKKVLEKLKKTHTLGLYTEGYKDHQFRKIKKGGLLDYFQKEHQYILFNKRTPRVINSLPKDCIVIDDNPEVIEQLMSRSDITPIWINRKDQAKHPHVYTIHSLEELLLLV